MFRSDWDLITPTVWLGDFAGEEAFFGGRGSDAGLGDTEVTFIMLPDDVRGGRRRVQHHRRHRGRPQRPQEETTTMEGISEEAPQPKTPSLDTEMAPAGGADEKQRLLNEDFFADLPLGSRQFDTRMPPALAPPKETTKDGYSYFTYSYSCCAALDDSAETAQSTRRRYEDSSGCLKAVHQRQLGNVALESTWLKKSAEDPGRHSQHVTKGDVKAFEEAWAHTPFGVATQRALAKGEPKQTELPDAPPPHEIP